MKADIKDNFDNNTVKKSGGGFAEVLETGIAVIGGGAAGLASAIAAAEVYRGSDGVMVLEGQPRTCRKLLSTGNGRCNLSADDVCAGKYHTDAPQVLKAVLENVPDAIEYFKKMGLVCRREGSRIYPYSGQANGVADCLRRTCERLEVKEKCAFFAGKIIPSDGSFLICEKNGSTAVKARRVILASGGLAAGRLGANGSGLELAEALGHTLTAAVFPALTPVKVKNAYSAHLKGIRCNASVRLVCDGKMGAPRCGELQFAENSLSGICVFEISRAVGEFFVFGTVDGVCVRDLKISVDLTPDFTERQLIELLKKNSLEDTLLGLFNRRIVEIILKNGKSAEECAGFIKDWRFIPGPAPDFSSAQVMAGGVLCASVDFDLQSKIFPGLYFAGELLNVDGDCGGYNLHFAWASGFTAGRAAASALNAACMVPPRRGRGV